MPATAKLLETFQISIPKGVREAHDWRPGQRFAFVPHSGGYLLIPVPSRDDLFGVAEATDTSCPRPPGPHVMAIPNAESPLET